MKARRTPEGYEDNAIHQDCCILGSKLHIENGLLKQQHQAIFRAGTKHELKPVQNTMTSSPLDPLSLSLVSLSLDQSIRGSSAQLDVYVCVFKAFSN